MLSGAVRNWLLHALQIFDNATASGVAYEDAARQGRDAAKARQPEALAIADVCGDQVDPPDPTGSHSTTHTIADCDDDDDSIYEFKPGSAYESQPISQTTFMSSSSLKKEKYVDIIIYLAVSLYLDLATVPFVNNNS